MVGAYVLPPSTIFPLLVVHSIVLEGSPDPTNSIWRSSQLMGVSDPALTAGGSTVLVTSTVFSTGQPVNMSVTNRS